MLSGNFHVFDSFPVAQLPQIIATSIQKLGVLYPRNGPFRRHSLRELPLESVRERKERSAGILQSPQSLVLFCMPESWHSSKIYWLIFCTEDSLGFWFSLSTDGHLEPTASLHGVVRNTSACQIPETHQNTDKFPPWKRIKRINTAQKKVAYFKHTPSLLRVGPLGSLLCCSSGRSLHLFPSQVLFMYLFLGGSHWFKKNKK